MTFVCPSNSALAEHLTTTRSAVLLIILSLIPAVAALACFTKETTNKHPASIVANSAVDHMLRIPRANAITQS